MVHKIYIAFEQQQGKRAYLVVHQSTTWSNDSACFSKGLNFSELSGYLQGANAATLGDMTVTNGIPEDLAQTFKARTSLSIKEGKLALLLKTSGLK
jgi:hypothetical protein